MTTCIPMNSRLFVQLALLALLLNSLCGEEWTRFRGNGGAGISLTSKTPTTWSDTEHVKWRADLPGPGSSSPVTTGDRVFITCYSGADGNSTENLKRYLVCLDRVEGKELWSKEINARQPEDPYRGFLTEHGYASNSPVTDGKNVYVFFGKSGVFAYDLEGKELWKRHLGSDSTRKQWGSAASPVLVGDVLIG